MALGIVPNGMKVEWNYTQNAIPVVNRVFVTKTGAVDDTDLEEVAAAAADFYATLQGGQHPTLILQNITVTDVSVANGHQIVNSFTTGNAGTATGTAMAANAAMVSSLRTANTGRAFRGRMYFGGLPQSALTDAQNVNVTFADGFSDLVMDFIDALGLLGKKLVVVSNYLNGAVRVVALATEIISVITDTKVDSQRRRTAN